MWGGAGVGLAWCGLVWCGAGERRVGLGLVLEL